MPQCYVIFHVNMLICHIFRYNKANFVLHLLKGTFIIWHQWHPLHLKYLSNLKPKQQTLKVGKTNSLWGYLNIKQVIGRDSLRLPVELDETQPVTRFPTDLLCRCGSWSAVPMRCRSRRLGGCWDGLQVYTEPSHRGWSPTKVNRCWQNFIYCKHKHPQISWPLYFAI